FFAPLPQNPPAMNQDAGVGVGPPPVAVTAPTTVPGVTSSPPSVPTAGEPVREVTKSRETSRYVFSSAGGVLVNNVLEGRKTREQEHLSLRQGWERLLGKKAHTPAPMNLAVPVPDGPAPLALAIDGANPLSMHVHYAVVQEGPRKILFRAEQ